MSMPPNATPHPVTRFVDRLGARPDLGRSDGWHWRLVVSGVVLFVVNALPEAAWVSSPADQYARMLALCVGLNMAWWGASGLLLSRGKEAPSLWFSALQVLLFFPAVAILFLLLYEWLGLPWAVGLALAACAISAVHWRRSRQCNEGA